MEEPETHARNGAMDETAVRAQLEQHHAASYGWALSCCARDPDVAADVLQATYLKVLQGRARHDGRSSFKTWLFAVIRITAADDRRRHWLRRLRLAEYQRQWEPNQPAADRGAGLDRSERARVFQRALGRLARRQREVLHLAFYQELSLQEAALVMGVSVGSARTHYERGKRNLRKWLEQSEYIDEYRRNRERTETALP